MVKISLDNNNLSKIHPLSKIGTDLTSGRNRTHVSDESIKILLSDDLRILRTNTGQAGNETVIGGFRNEIN